MTRLSNRVCKLLYCVLLVLPMAAATQSAFGQNPVVKVVELARPLPSASEQALTDTNRSSNAHLQAVERNWREVFRQTRDPERLKGFVGETLGVFEKFRQFKDMTFAPGATDARIGALFRKRILDEAAVCRSLEQALNEYCRLLDEQDRALLIKLKIDRNVAQTNLPRSVIDPAAFKRPINAVAASTVTAVQNDMARSIVSFVSSEMLSAAAKKSARSLGINRTEPGSFADFLTGLVIDIGTNAVVDAVTDPTNQMVSDLRARLTAAEREILDGTPTTPGFITTLRRITNDRAVARRKLLEAELLK